MLRTRALFVLVLGLLLTAPAIGSAQHGRRGVLALRIDDEASALIGAEGGGQERLPGHRPAALPLTVRGSADALSGLVDNLAKGHRFDGELVLTRGRARQQILSFDKARATELTVPALDGRGPFALAVKIDAEDTDVGPFESRAAKQRNRRRARAWSRMRRAVRRLSPARAELSVDGLGDVRPHAVGELTVSRPPGHRMSVSALWVTLDRDDAGEWVEAFEATRRLGATRLRYVDRGGHPLLEVAGEHARITAARPDYEGGGVQLRLALDDPSLSVPAQ